MTERTEFGPGSQAVTINLKQSINTSDQKDTIRSFEGPAPNLLNNGSHIDAGVTTIYEKTGNDASYVGEVFAADGARISIDSSSNVYVNDDFIGVTSKYFIDSTVALPGKYIDAVISNTGTILASWNNNGTATFDELNVDSSGSVIIVGQKTILPAGIGTVDLVYIWRSNSQTLAGITDAIVVSQSTPSGLFTIKYLTGAGLSNISGGIIPKYERIRVGGAYKNAGGWVLGSPDNITLYSANVPTGAWTATAQVQYVAPTQILASATTTMALIATCQFSTNQAFVAKTVTISNVGVITITNVVPAAPAPAGLAVQSANYACPWGSSGTLKTTAITVKIPYSYPFTDYQTYRYCNDGITATDTAMFPDAVGNWTDGIRSYKYKTAKGKAAIFSVGFDTNMASGLYDPGKAINTFGDLFDGFVPLIRNESGTRVLLQNSSYILNVTFISTNIRFNQVSQSIVRLENCTAYCLIDTKNKLLIKDWSSIVSSSIVLQSATGTNTFEVLGSNNYSSMIDMSVFTQTGTISALSVTTAADDITGSYFYTNGIGNNFVTYGKYGANSGSTPATPIVPPTLVPSFNLPIPGSATISQGGVTFYNGSAIQVPDQSAYQLVNKLANRLSFFRLYGGIYAYDSGYIYSVTLSNGSTGTIVGIPNFITGILGLTFIANSPTVAFFLSTYDNSIWAFDGGRTVSKVMLFNQKNAIQSGVFNVKNNQLQLFTGATIISVTDSIITENTQPYGTLNAYSTSDGIYYVDKSTNINWTFRSYQNPLGGAVIPLNFQTAFFGFGDNSSFYVHKLTFTICYVGLGMSSPSRITITWNWITANQDGTQAYGTEAHTYTPTTQQVNSQGEVRISLEPPTQNNMIAASIGIASEDTTQKIIIMNEVMMIVANAGDTNIPLKIL